MVKTLFKQFLMFGLAGIAGFCVDAGILYLLKGMLGIYWARAISFLCAVCTTWVFNRNFTFSDRMSNRSILGEFVSYFGMMLAGGAANLLCYVLMVSGIEFVRQHPVLGVVGGSLAGMGVNYLQLRLIMFRHPKSG